MLRKEVPDVYQYDQIPRPLRVQIVHILRDLFGRPEAYGASGCREAFENIEDLLCREYGLFNFPSTKDYDETAEARVVKFLLNEQNHERVLDVVEISFRFLEFLRQSSYDWQRRVPNEKLEALKAELNARFREHGVGYQYESGEIIRVDSQLIHAEIVKPALVLLTAPEYAGANAEFLKAFELYRKGDTKGCLNECLKAFESTMKAICTKRKWAYQRHHVFSREQLRSHREKGCVGRSNVFGCGVGCSRHTLFHLSGPVACDRSVRRVQCSDVSLGAHAR